MFDLIGMPGSYLGIILFLVLTGCGLPIPEEVPIVLAGVLSAKGQLVPEWAFAACLIGALLGDSLMYLIGYHFGHNLLREHFKIWIFADDHIFNRSISIIGVRDYVLNNLWFRKAF